MEKLDLDLTLLGRRLNSGVEYGFRTSSGDEYWCKQYELKTVMGRVTRIRLWHYLRYWEKSKEKPKTNGQIMRHSNKCWLQKIGRLGLNRGMFRINNRHRME